MRSGGGGGGGGREGGEVEKHLAICMVTPKEFVFPQNKLKLI